MLLQLDGTSSPLDPPSLASLRRSDTQMYHTSSLLDDPAFFDEALRDLKLGKKLRDAHGGPLVVAQLAGDDPEAMGRAGKLLVGLVDALGELDVEYGRKCAYSLTRIVPT